MTRKWIDVTDLSGGKYSINNKIRFKTPILNLDSCDYSDTYIVVKEKATLEGTDDANKGNKKLTFKSNVPFRSSVSKINNTFIADAEDIDFVMLMYNL